MRAATLPAKRDVPPDLTARETSRFTNGTKRWLPILIGPVTVGLALVYVAALIGLTLGLTNWNLISAPQWIGLENFRFALEDPRFWRANLNTVILVVLTVPAKLLIGLGLAVALNRIGRFGTFFRLALFFPFTASIIAVSYIWLYIYDAEGLLNQIGSSLGLSAVNWISPQFALSSVALMVVWMGVGYVSLLYLAGLQTIPTEYYDASKIDGASGWQRFRYITFPLLTPTTFFVLVTSLIVGFQTFAEVYVFRGPLDSTLTIVAYIYERSFAGLQMGYGAAISAFLIAVLLLLTIVQFRVQSRWVNYDL